MSILETTASKLQQLPEPLLEEVSNFIDFIVMKHQLQSKSREETGSISERWAKWFDEIDRLEFSPTEPVNEYQEGLLRKYRQQGLEL